LEFATHKGIFIDDNIFSMLKLMDALKRLSLPFALLFVLLSGGVAIVENCHTQINSEIGAINSTVIHTHTDGSHNHAASKHASEPLSNSYEACFAIGFVVLLFIRFFKLKLQLLKFRSLEYINLKIVNFQNATSHLINLNHIQLGVIRI
jgi:hypothetical protein